jgi:hypothetical protein
LNHPLQCRCGTVKGYVSDPQTVNRAVCYCRDCQAFAHFLGRAADILDAQGGTDVIQTLSARVIFSEGREVLACMRLSRNGLMRWYTTCCNTPIGNTLPNFRFSFVGLIHSCLESGDVPLEGDSDGAEPSGTGTPDERRMTNGDLFVENAPCRLYGFVEVSDCTVAKTACVPIVFVTCYIRACLVQVSQCFMNAAAIIRMCVGGRMIVKIPTIVDGRFLDVIDGGIDLADSLCFIGGLRPVSGMMLDEPACRPQV